jgi:hypothetical protein
MHGRLSGDALAKQRQAREHAPAIETFGFAGAGAGVSYVDVDLRVRHCHAPDGGMVIGEKRWRKLAGQYLPANSHDMVGDRPVRCGCISAGPGLW